MYSRTIVHFILSWLRVWQPTGSPCCQLNLKRTIESKRLVPFIEGCKGPPWGVTIGTLGPRRPRRRDDPKGRKPAIKSGRRPLQLPRTPRRLPNSDLLPRLFHSSTEVLPSSVLCLHWSIAPAVPQELHSVRKSSVLRSDGQLGDYSTSWPITGHSSRFIFGPPARLILSRGLFRLQ